MTVSSNWVRPRFFFGPNCSTPAVTVSRRWEAAHLPLYTLWSTGNRGARFVCRHPIPHARRCADRLRHHPCPHADRRSRLAGTVLRPGPRCSTLYFGLGYAVFQRIGRTSSCGSWHDSAAMLIVPLGGLRWCVPPSCCNGLSCRSLLSAWCAVSISRAILPGAAPRSHPAHSAMVLMALPDERVEFAAQRRQDQPVLRFTFAEVCARIHITVRTILFLLVGESSSAGSAQSKPRSSRARQVGGL